MTDVAPIVIETADSSSQREDIYRFRYEIYVQEMGKVRLSQADHGRRWLKDDIDDRATLYAARQNGEIIGTLRSLNGRNGIPQPYGQLPHFDRFAQVPPAALSFSGRLMVAPGQRGGSALTALVGHAYEEGLRNGVHFDFCVCAPGLVDLYEHLGFRRFTGNLVDPVVGYQVPLVLAARDRTVLRAVQSPLWRLLRRHPESEVADNESLRLVRWLGEMVPLSPVVQEWVDNEDAYWRFLAGKVRTAAGGTPSILEELDEDEQKRLLKGGTILDCVAGDRVITAGAVGSEVFVVLQGLLEVRLPGQDNAIAILDNGQVFGEIAFIADSTRTADVVSLTESRVLVLSRNTLNRLMKTSPELAAKLMFNLSRVLCERLVTSNRRMAGNTP